MDEQKFEDLVEEEKKDATHFWNEVWLEVTHKGEGRVLRGYEMKEMS